MKTENRLPFHPVIPETEDQKRRYREAGERREYRLAGRPGDKG